VNWDLSRYLALFVSESKEHLDALAQGLVRLERAGAGGGDPAPLIDELFRHAHSVKGMAAAMQQEGIAHVAHRAEDVIGVLRAQGGVPGPDVVDVLLAATDAITAMVEQAATGTTPAADEAVSSRLDAQASRLRGIVPAEADPPGAAGEAQARAADADEPLQGEVVAAPTPARTGAPPELPPPAPPSGRRLRIEVEVSASSPVPSIRGFLVLKRLGDTARIAASSPTVDELRAGRMPDRRLTAEIETSSTPEEITRTLEQIADLARVEVREATPVAPPPPVTPEPPAEPPRTVRVRAEMLDDFLDVAGELLLATARLREAGRAIPEPQRREHDEGVDRLQAIAKDLHRKVMSARMTPLTALSARLPRAARDLARRTGKQVDVVVTGAEIEVDRALLDEIGDPLLHLLRNAVDHGVETAAQRIASGKRPTGRIEVSARRDRDRVILEVSDDGQGMDAAALRRAAVANGSIAAEAAANLSDADVLLLACLPGVSTASQVTEVSGRGVGMDAVKRSAEALGGTLSIESQPGKGTRFTLRLPLTVAMQPVLLVRVGTEILAIPVSKVHGAAEARLELLERAGGAPQLAFGGGHVPVYDLGVLLGTGPAPGGGRRSVVITDSDTGRVGLAVDQLLGQQEAVLKPLHGPLSLVPGLSAVTVLGNGRPVFVLDIPRLVAA
jgi:two-component system, chemotaxis family, sensor kinase CheA